MAPRSPLPIPAFVRKALAPRDPMIAYRAALLAADGPNTAHDWPQAEARNADLLRINPLRAEAWVAYGEALEGQGRGNDAIAAYSRAAELEPENVAALVRLGDARTALGDSAGALDAFGRAYTADPTDEHVRQRIRGLGGIEPGEVAPPLFRDVDDLPIRAADTVAKRGASSPSLAFIHLQKTGGMTLHHTLERYFPPQRVCPIRDDHMHLCPATARAGYDFFSGHFDVGALRLLGDRPIRTMSIFREPRARLISFYRFHAGHALAGTYAGNHFVRLAHEMSAEEFFEHPRIRREPEIFNHYLVAFGLTYHQLRSARHVAASRIDESLVARAVDRVRRLDAIALLERLSESLDLMFEALGLRPPRRVVTRNETDRVAVRMNGIAPPQVEITPRLDAALDELIRFDRIIYAAAKAEFERRLALRPRS